LNGSVKLYLYHLCTAGQTTPEVNLSVMGEKQTLRVSWSVHPQFSDSVLEYVVQHVSVVPHLACLSWVRVNRTQTSVTITGVCVCVCVLSEILLQLTSEHILLVLTSKKGQFFLLFKSSVLHMFL
jgi:hypothetical protein